ncbi:hypothetical protein SAMN05446037_1003156 [Anaerovirgula multivorans]|uniref:Uncharacterized protein n=1 Tax=Anaerovirgula multivorans TaxID=312168 RepID=A0A239BBL3_9FIRM|nr:hypothetical protein SAMN05446037_1003156 [Anaerovirgula multivorans]
MFIASDHLMQVVDYSKTKYYKFKQGVKMTIDNEEKLYYYTN